MAELGQCVARLRGMRGMTQLQLAHAARTHNISQLECGHFSPGLRTLLRVATALGVTVADLLPESDGSHRAPGVAFLDELLVGATERELKIVLAVVGALARDPGEKLLSSVSPR